MAIEKAPSKNWELTLYEIQRTPQPLITDESEIAICPLRLSNELKCPICLDFLNNTMATKECLHRFCSQCIVTALRSGNKECPACRKKLVSKRSLRHDPNFDAIIAKLFPYRKEYEAHQATVMAKQIKQTIKPVKIDNLEPINKKSESDQQESGTNQSWSNNEAESGSSKEQGSTISTCPPKYRSNIKFTEGSSLSLHTDNNDSIQVDDEYTSAIGVEVVVPIKRLRHASSESGDPETNCSSSITSELCSIVGNQSRDGGSQSNAVISDKVQPYTFIDNPIDIVLEPLDGRKTKLNEAFVLQIPDVTTVGHLIEFLNIRRNEMNKIRRTSLDCDLFVKSYKVRHAVDEVTYNIFLGMTSNEKKVATSLTDPSRQSTSSAIRITRKSMNTKLELTDKLSTVITNYSLLHKKKNKKELIKQAASGSQEFLVFYYQEVSPKMTGTNGIAATNNSNNNSGSGGGGADGTN